MNRAWMTGLLIGAAGLLGACTTVKVDDDLIPHLLVASAEGNLHLVRPTTYSSVPLRADVADDDAVSPTGPEALAHIGRILDHIDETADQSEALKRVVLFVHGGLNTHEGGLARAAERYRQALDAGAYPVFVNWKSGGFTAYAGHLFDVRDGHLVGASGKLTWPVYLASDVLDAIAVVPKAWWQQGSESLRFSLADAQDLREPISRAPAVNIHLGERAATSNAGHLKNFALWLATSPAKLVTTPFSYSLGKPSWDMMNRRAHELIFRSCEFELDGRRCESEVSLTPQRNEIGRLREVNPTDSVDSVCANSSDQAVCSGVLSVFLKELTRRRAGCGISSKGLCRLQIAIVGHSMGAIVVTQALRYFHHLRFDDIVFMGGAVTSRAAVDTLVPYLQDCRNRRSHFYNLSLDVTLENRERNWFGMLPDGSLLTWIDSMYGLPPNEIDRTFGRWENARRTMRLVPADVAPRMHFRVFGNGATDPANHADFSQQPFWNPDFWWPTDRGTGQNCHQRGMS